MARRKLLRVIRAEHEPRLTQAAVAHLACMSRLRYWSIERGETLPTIHERALIANALEVSLTAIAWPVLTKRERSA